MNYWQPLPVFCRARAEWREPFSKNLDGNRNRQADSTPIYLTIPVVEQASAVDLSATIIHGIRNLMRHIFNFSRRVLAAQFFSIAGLSCP
jgi:hypothetical protein